MPKTVLKCTMTGEMPSEDYLSSLRESNSIYKVVVADVKDGQGKVLEALFIRNDGKIEDIIAVDKDGNYYAYSRNQSSFAVLANVLDACLTGIKLSTIIAFMPDINPALTSFFLSRLTRSVNPRNWEFSQFKEVF